MREIPANWNNEWNQNVIQLSTNTTTSPCLLVYEEFWKKIEIMILWNIFYMTPRAYGIPIDGLQFRAAVDTGVV